MNEEVCEPNEFMVRTVTEKTRTKITTGQNNKCHNIAMVSDRKTKAQNNTQNIRSLLPEETVPTLSLKGGHKKTTR